jgi:choline dehydrogenase-like flavoprotein
MTNRNGAPDDDCDMLVIGSGLGGSVVALQMAKKKYRSGLLAIGRRSPDEQFADATWDIKRFAWAPLGLKNTRRVLWLPRVVIHGRFGVVGCWRVAQRIRNSRSSRILRTKQRQFLQLLSAVLGCLRRAIRLMNRLSAQMRNFRRAS